MSTQNAGQNQLSMWTTFDAGHAWHRKGKVLVAVGCAVGKIGTTAVERARPFHIELLCLVMADEFELGSTLCIGGTQSIVRDQTQLV